MAACSAAGRGVTACASGRREGSSVDGALHMVCCGSAVFVRVVCAPAGCLSRVIAARSRLRGQPWSPSPPDPGTSSETPLVVWRGRTVSRACEAVCARGGGAPPPVMAASTPPPYTPASLTLRVPRPARLVAHAKRLCLCHQPRLVCCGAKLLRDRVELLDLPRQADPHTRLLLHEPQERVALLLAAVDHRRLVGARALKRDAGRHGPDASELRRGGGGQNPPGARCRCRAP